MDYPWFFHSVHLFKEKKVTNKHNKPRMLDTKDLLFLRTN